MSFPSSTSPDLEQVTTGDRNRHSLVQAVMRLTAVDLLDTRGEMTPPQQGSDAVNLKEKEKGKRNPCHVQNHAPVQL
jgi:hypothetical protein